MDTDDLTEMAYNIITKAYGVSEFLAPQIGASCSNYKSEDMFLNGTEKIINKLIDHPKSHLEYWHLLETVDVEEFKEKLIDLHNYIKQVINTPLSKRGKAFE